jgi:pyruvate-ferredoxin/flavodoxin oxidoreductase
MDDDGGELQAYYENELQERYALYEQMAQGSGTDVKTDAKKPADA